MPKVDAITAAQRWVQGAQAGASRYAEGVAGTTKDPTALAIAAGPRYLQGVQDSFNNGTWANGLRRTGKAGWQQAVAAKGVQNYGTGVTAAQDEVGQAFSPLFSYMANLESQIASMPNVTDIDRNNRMLAWVNGMRLYVRPA